MRCTCGHTADQHAGTCRECRCPTVTDDTSPVLTMINGRWPLLLPPHRAYRPQWAPDGGGWEPERTADIIGRIEPGHLVFDVGAEEGDLPALWASQGAAVVAVEPNPAVWSNIRVCFDVNGLTPAGCFVGFCGAEARDEPAGVSDGWPQVAVGDPIHDHGFCQLNERPDLPVTTIDRLTGRFGPPDAVTIDVEGSEYEVLRGAIRTLLTVRPTVWVSVHPTFMVDQYDTDPDVLHRFMTDAGYHGVLLAIDHEQHFRYDPKEKA